MPSPALDPPVPSNSTVHIAQTVGILVGVASPEAPAKECGPELAGVCTAPVGWSDNILVQVGNVSPNPYAWTIVGGLLRP